MFSKDKQRCDFGVLLMNGQSIEVVNISYVLVMSDIRSWMGVLGAQMAYRFNSNQ